MLGTHDESSAVSMTGEHPGLLPGGLIRQVAGELAGRGLNVAYPVHDDSRCLKVTGLPGRYCSVEVGDDGYVLLEYWPAVRLPARRPARKHSWPHRSYPGRRSRAVASRPGGLLMASVRAQQWELRERMFAAG
jgi:hypothetical protein